MREPAAAISAALLLGTSGACAAALLRSRSSARLRARILPPQGIEGSPRAGRGILRAVRRPAILAAGPLVGFALGGPPVAVAGLLVAWLGPRWRRRMRERSARAAADEGLAQAMASISAALRAGHSLARAIRFAAEEAEPPLDRELGEIADRNELGVPLAEALDRWAESHGGRDVRLVLGVLRLHRRTGGDLPRVLDELSRTLQERRAAVAEIRSLTAQGRLSGTILGLLPVAFLIFLSLTAREDIEAAYRSTAGLAAIGIGATLQLAAWMWIRRILSVEA